MPKSKVSKSSTPQVTSTSANRTPVKINNEGTPKWYIVLMLGLMILGLAGSSSTTSPRGYLVHGRARPPWNYGIGFGLAIVGLLMTMGWR